ncbi:MAG: SPFH domain-containing protein, partial [bacterium]|nr:SPFH domain-containing protein [bacterium]
MEGFFQPSVLGGMAAVFCFFFGIVILNTLVRVCSPRQVLVVTGTKTRIQDKEYGFRLLKGGWTFVIPYFQSVQALDLSIIPVNVRIEGVNSANGITVGADATACVCVDIEDETLLYSAVERLMGKSRQEIQAQIQQTMIGNFRGALNKTTPLQAIGMVESVENTDPNEEMAVDGEAEGERAQFRSELLSDSTQDLSTFGMRVVSVSLQKIWDTSNYIANLANKTLSYKRQEVEIEEARLGARAERAESDAQRREMIAESQANEKILEAQQELEVIRQQCEADVERVRLEADSAIVKANSEGERSIQEETIALQQLKNSSNVTLEAKARYQAAEILAAGESEAVRIVAETHNDLLRQKAELVAKAGDLGKIALFVQQQLPHLFTAYQTHAKGLRVDNLVVMDDKRGFNGVVNRGPEALVDFLHH